MRVFAISFLISTFIWSVAYSEIRYLDREYLHYRELLKLGKEYEIKPYFIHRDEE